MIAEVRGEGLLLGLRCVVPNGELVDALRAEKLLAVAAGDNVVRLLPPLIVERGGDRPRRWRSSTAPARGSRAPRSRRKQGGRRVSAAPRHFLDLTEIPDDELRGIIEASRAMKDARKRDRAAADKPLAGKTLAMIFDKPSTRTRVSFDVAMRQLGGDVIMLTGAGDAARPRRDHRRHRAGAVALRRRDHDPHPRPRRSLIELARHATVPVINGLTRLSHPCQVMADVMTFEEHKRPDPGRTVAWTGDANNVLASWMHAAQALRLPPARSRRRRSCKPKQMAARLGASSPGAAIRVGHDPEEAVADADCVVTDTWVSMGDKDGEQRHNLLKPYQVNARLMAQAQARRDLHALPAGASRRGSDRRGDRRPAIGGVRRGREPPACPEGHPGLVPRAR